MKAKLGTGPEGAFDVDISKLVETRLLIQANSGGGKSYVIRKLLEITFGKIQHIVLDPEGEFPTLREKHDYILAGKGGDIPAQPQSANLLARKILELKASAIVDLYELKAYDRIRFVKVFLEAMVNAPKVLWHPVLVILDESHVFSPEKSKAESAGAVIDMATRGRKRGFCLIPATQRLSKLNKDVAAECNNKMIGRTGLDIDMKRAAEELGFVSKAQMLGLRDLAPGEFYAFGPALCRSVQKVKVGKVQTTHPRSGDRIKSFTPAATSRIKAVLTKMKDLPQQAETETRTLEDAKIEIRKLKRDLRAVPIKSDEKAIERAHKEGLTKGRTEGEKYRILFRKALGFGDVAEAALKKLTALLNSNPPEPAKVIYSPTIPVSDQFKKKKAELVVSREPGNAESNGQLGRCERSILGFLISYPGRAFSKVQVAVMSGYSHSSGGFNNSLGKLNSMNLIQRNGGKLMCDVGSDLSGLDIEANSGNLDSWLARLGRCERAIFETLREVGEDDAINKIALGELTNYSPSSGGFNNALGRLNSLGLIKRNGNGTLTINPEISEL